MALGTHSPGPRLVAEEVCEVYGVAILGDLEEGIVPLYTLPAPA